MRVAIDASRAAGAQKTGVGWYCHHLLAHLRDVIPDDVGVMLYSDQPLPTELRPWPTAWEERVLAWRPLPLWSQVRLAVQVLRDRPDVLFVPAHVIPELLARGYRLSAIGYRLVTTIHDVVFKQFPETYSRRERWYADYATRLAVRHAHRIIVPTEAVKRDLQRWYGADPEHITVVHHGVESGICLPRPKHRGNLESGDDDRSVASSTFHIPHSTFLLYVGRLEHKKNVVRMVEAFTRIAPQHPDVRLVLAGLPGHGYGAVVAAIERSSVRDRIVVPGWVSRDEYRGLLSRATAFLFPTLGEGFGLPILEAMAAGVPVITSVGGAHGEVAGDAALLVDSLDSHAIADAINRVLDDQLLRDDLVRRGRQHAAAFTWNRTAQQTWNVLST